MVVSVATSSQTVSVTLPQDAEVDWLLHWASARPARRTTIARGIERLMVGSRVAE
jgi:hypothetical protein